MRAPSAPVAGERLLHSSRCATAAPQLPPLRRRRRRPQCSGGIRARWSFRAKFGELQQASVLMKEWVAEFAAPGGAGNVEILAGSIGSDSVEANLTFASLSELEAFFASVSQDRYRTWVDRSRDVILDGSTRWELFRIVQDSAGSSPPTAAAAAAAPAPAPAPPSLVLSSVEDAEGRSPADDNADAIAGLEPAKSSSIIIPDSSSDGAQKISAAELLKLVEQGRAWADDYDETGRIRPPPASPGDKLPGAS